MIIFDLDTLANCEHRRHFVDPKKNVEINHKWIDLGSGKTHLGIAQENGAYRLWQPDFRSFYEACDKDEPIQQTIELLWALQKSFCTQNIECWSGRCESVREKTLKWFDEYIDPAKYWNWDKRLKMRPIGDSTPDDVLKERWLDAYILNLDPPLKPMAEDGIMDKSIFKKNPPIDFVFDSDPKSIAMWRRRGIFVFDCNQDEREI